MPVVHSPGIQRRGNTGRETIVESFRRAVVSKDPDAIVATLADDVIFSSPIVFREYTGKIAVGFILRAVLAVLEDFHYVADLRGGAHTALVFRARVGGKDLEGIDLIEATPTGLVARLTVFVRPLSGALALKEAMGVALGAAGEKASAKP
jgi:hypothetical protein